MLQCSYLIATELWARYGPIHCESDMGRYGPIHRESDDLATIFFNVKKKFLYNILLMHFGFSNLSYKVGIFLLIVLVCKATEDLILKYSGTQGIGIHNLPNLFLILKIPGDYKIIFFCHIR